MEHKGYRIEIEETDYRGRYINTYKLSTEQVDADYDVSMFDWSYLVTGSPEQLAEYAAEEDLTVEYTVTLARYEYDENGDLADWDLIDIDGRTRAEIAASILKNY